MRVHQGFLGLVALGLIAGHVPAQSVEQTSFLFRRHAAPAPCTNCAPASGPVTVVPTTPTTPAPAPVGAAPAMDAQAFAQAPAAGGELGGSFNPAMFGDLGVAGSAFVTIRSSSASTGAAAVASSFGGVRVPIASRGAFKISDNESPRPSDRVFFTYNYYDRLNFGPGSDVGLHRELIGFEKTFLGGNASFGMRLPFMQFSGLAAGSGIADNQVGDLTMIGKYALINDRETGSVVSGGLVLTAPTADHRVVLADGVAFRSWLFQPYAGWVLNSNLFYVQAFHALVVPTDSRDITVLNNDIGVGMWLLKNENSFIRAVVPTIEGHLFTPLNHRNNTTDILTASDIFTLTGGVNFVLPGNSTIGVGIAAPLTGPRPNNIEALASFNLRF
jgi:hypothetical protein